MITKGSLGDRMKSYEAVHDRRMLPGVPHIVRLDMVAGHTFTKNMDKPYDVLFHECMNEATLSLLRNVPNARLAYTQSDEITLVLNDATINDNYAPFYSNRVSKIESIMASRCTNAFITRYLIGFMDDVEYDDAKYPDVMKVAFDARAFDVPNVVEAYNCLLWRQQDAKRNAWQALGHAVFNHDEIQGMSNGDLMAMLENSGVDFSVFPDDYWKGTVYLKDVQNDIITTHDITYDEVMYAYDYGMGREGDD